MCTCCCEGPLGAVREEDLPSWFTAAPRTIAIAFASGLSPLPSLHKLDSVVALQH